MTAASLLAVVGQLWEEACQCANTTDHTLLERAIRCLYAGLEFVLPTTVELPFRLFLVHLLYEHTRNANEAVQHLQKCLILIQNVHILGLSNVYRTQIVQCYFDS